MSKEEKERQRQRMKGKRITEKGERKKKGKMRNKKLKRP